MEKRHILIKVDTSPRNVSMIPQGMIFPLHDITKIQTAKY